MNKCTDFINQFLTFISCLIIFNFAFKRYIVKIVGEKRAKITIVFYFGWFVINKLDKELIFFFYEWKREYFI